MDEVRVIELKESVFADNDRKADEVRQALKKQGTFLLNVMSSPGAGKTCTLTRLINLLKNDFSCGVMEADIDGDIDTSDIIKNTGAKAVQLHTGGMCHLDAGMTEEGLQGLDGSGLDLIFLENVGNLVCPAEFDTGASKNLVLLSVPEGDDKPLKYPLMFEKADIVAVNKIDVLAYFDFDKEKFETWLKQRNDRCDVLYISAKTGEGMEALADWTKKQVHAWKEG